MLRHLTISPLQVLNCDGQSHGGAVPSYQNAKQKTQLRGKGANLAKPSFQGKGGGLGDKEDVCKRDEFPRRCKKQLRGNKLNYGAVPGTEARGRQDQGPFPEGEEVHEAKQAE